MGATTFTAYSPNTDPAAAFAAAVDEAQYERGHGGYSGSIAEKEDFTVASPRPVPLADALSMARELTNTDPWDDKYGPAGAIAVRGSRRSLYVDDVVGSLPFNHDELTATLTARRLIEPSETVAAVLGGAYQTLGHGARTRFTGSLTLAVDGDADQHTGWLFFGWAAE